jgi:Mrp family chromosome partitioning ATPase
VSNETTPRVFAEESAASEAYRILRSTLKFASGDPPVRSILVVDIDRREPSGVALRLAHAFSRAGDRCVLIETDVRQGPRDPGLGDLIRGMPATDVTRRPNGSGPSVVTSGSVSDPDLLAGDGFERALSELLASYDYAILSAASLPAHGDALAIAPRVDAVILIVSSGRTRRGRAVEAREALDRVGARMLGVVMLESKRSRFW